MPALEPGLVVALTSVRAWPIGARDEETAISGLFVLDEWIPYEPSAYHWQGGWIVLPRDRDGHPGYFVDADDLWEQVDPQDYGRRRAEENEAYIASMYEEVQP